MDLFGMTSAQFTANGRGRLVLYRCWNSALPSAMVIGLNPSTANGETDDPTIGFVKRCLAFNGFGSLYMVNLFTMVATNPEDLVRDDDEAMAVSIWKEVNRKCDIVVFAWGNFKVFGRDKLAIDLFPGAQCFDILQSGAPRHPMYLKSTTRLKSYAPSLKRS